MDFATVLGAAVKTLAAGLVALLLLTSGAARAELHYLIVGGIGGDPSYTESFAESAAAMVAAAIRTTGDEERVRVLVGENGTLESLRSAMAEYSANLSETDQLAVFLIGHGSHDGVEYKFNLTGPDIVDSEFAEMLNAIAARRQLVVNTSSSSGSILEVWAGDGRAVITATRSGRERNATRFAEHWAKSLSSDDADVDKNGAITAQEAFDFASRQVADSFEAQEALATEHPEIRGEIAAGFEVARLSARTDASPAATALYAELDELMAQAAMLQQRRLELGDDYQGQMLDVQVEIARVQLEIDQLTAGE